MDDVPPPEGLLRVWNHPGLEALAQESLILQLVLMPGRHRNVSWSVFDTGDASRFRVRRVQIPGWSAFKEGGGTPQLFGSDGLVLSEDVETSLEDYNQLTKPLMPEPFWGVNGINYLISHAPGSDRIVGKAWSPDAANPAVEAVTRWFHHTAEQVLDLGLPKYSSRTPRLGSGAKPPSDGWRY